MAIMVGKSFSKEMHADCLAEIHHMMPVVTYEEERKHRSTINLISCYTVYTAWNVRSAR